MSGDGDKPDYEVGYKKPPVESRFQAGNWKGNHKGRPRKSRNLKSDFQDEMAERITLKEGNRSIRISKQRALVKALVVKGIKGDERAIGRAFEILLRLVGNEDQASEVPALSDEDQAILDAFLKRGEHKDEPR
jgi:hypothetical protein